MTIWTWLGGSDKSPEESLWKSLNSEEDWLRVAADSVHEQQWIFKHSYSCGISAAVLRRLESRMLQWKLPTGRYLVDVNANRQISQRIARETEVVHQSPQLLILSNGEVIWHASHYDILDVDPEASGLSSRS